METIIINNYCSICENDFKNDDEYNKHMKSEQHEKHRVNKGVYAFGGCPYCRVHLYLLQLPEHIKTIHKDHQEEWKGADEKDFINKLIFVNNKIQELREQNYY